MHTELIQQLTDRYMLIGMSSDSNWHIEVHACNHYSWASSGNSLHANVHDDKTDIKLQWWTTGFVTDHLYYTLSNFLVIIKTTECGPLEANQHDL